MPGPVNIKPARPRPSVAAASPYTFHKLTTLAHLPHRERAHEYLERLQADAGIQATMQHYRWSIGELCEMEPIGNTSATSRTLGRNHNRGARIEVRLRTDAYDGFRDYATVRRTIAHELAHMVHDEHDAAFWRLCGEVERRIVSSDWRSRGRPLTDEVFYSPPAGADADRGGKEWTGGGGVLGGVAAAGPSLGSGTALGKSAQSGNERREMMARAAEERLKRLER